MNTQKSLSVMKSNETGIVTGIHGGRGLTERLDVMGIRPGARLTVTSRSPLRGPVTVRVGNTQMALGFGMASKIVLDVQADVP